MHLSFKYNFFIYNSCINEINKNSSLFIGRQTNWAKVFFLIYTRRKDHVHYISKSFCDVFDYVTRK